MRTVCLVLSLLVASPLYGEDAVLNDRAVETFDAGLRPEWGYAVPQQDTFVVMHPKQDYPQAPLYVVLHSAGHDVMSCVDCTQKEQIAKIQADNTPTERPNLQNPTQENLDKFMAAARERRGKQTRRFWLF